MSSDRDRDISKALTSSEEAHRTMEMQKREAYCHLASLFQFQWTGLDCRLFTRSCRCFCF